LIPLCAHHDHNMASHVATEQSVEMELQVDLGPMPSDSQHSGVLDGLRNLLATGEFCDVILEVPDSVMSFHAHRAVLGAASPRLRTLLAASTSCAPAVLRLEGVSSPEAVRAFLDVAYGAAAEYNPPSEDANRDALRLAQDFEVVALRDAACGWLAKGLTTSNVLKRLEACEEFGLLPVRQKILEQVTSNPEALFALAKHPDALRLPSVLQDLLVNVLQLLGCDTGSQASPGSSVKNGKQKSKAVP